MASPALTLRNQQNAQHSTGPRTDAGKHRSSLNSFKHGLTAATVVLPSEDQAAYTRFQTDLFADLKPEGTTEQLLAQTVCDTQWRLERARAAETNIFALAQFSPLPPEMDHIQDPAQRSALMEARAWLTEERALRNLHQHEARLQRLLLHTLGELKALQSMRESRRQDLLDEAVNTKIHHQANSLPFDPAALGFVSTVPEIDRELKRIHILHHPLRPLSSEPKPVQSAAEKLAAFRAERELMSARPRA